MTDTSVPSPSLASTERARLLAAARHDIDLVRKRRTEISESFYEIGKALGRLRAEPVPKLLGFGTFAKLCSETLALSPATAAKLITIAERVSPKDALRWGPEKSAAVVNLANATGASGRIVRKGLPMNPEHASTREILAEARKQRARTGKRSARGKLVTLAEQQMAERIEQALHAAGVTAARVHAVAGPPGKPAYLRIDRIPFDAIRTFRKSLAAAA